MAGTQYVGLCHDDPSVSLSDLGLPDAQAADEDAGHGGQLAGGPRGRVPQRLRGVRWLALGTQVFLTTFPVLFIALAATAASLDKQPISDKGRAVQTAINLSPTVFGIIFAAIVGRFFRALGLYGAERGIRLGTLERLIGAQSLFAVVERQLALRGQWLLGLAMVLFWALSPLGGQSALRLLQVAPRLESANATVRYLPSAASVMTAMAGASGAATGWPSYAPLYMTALTTYRRQENASEDLFGNVRVPSLEALPPASSSSSSAGAVGDGDGSWRAVDHGQAVPYSSVLGVPVVGVPAAGNASFRMVSRYYAVGCDASRLLARTDVVANTSWALTADGRSDYDNGATFVVQVADAFRPGSGAALVSFNMTSPNSDDAKRNVSFVACSLAPRDVESAVLCVDASCRVTAVRNLTVDLGLWSDYDQPSIQRALLYLSAATVGELHHGTKVESSPTELWLQGPRDVLVTMALGEFSNLSAVPLPTLSRNFEMLFNTYWQSTYGAQYLSGNLTTANMSAYDDIYVDLPGQPVSFNTSQAALTSRSGEQYECDMAFAGILLAISCLLLLAGLASVVLMSVTIAPDILGYVSSYTRDNPFAAENVASSYLDGLERSNALKEMRVMLGDVNGERDTGYVALAASTRARPLRRDRVYF